MEPMPCFWMHQMNGTEFRISQRFLFSSKSFTFVVRLAKNFDHLTLFCCDQFFFSPAFVSVSTSVRWNLFGSFEFYSSHSVPSILARNFISAITISTCQKPCDMFESTIFIFDDQINFRRFAEN